MCGIAGFVNFKDGKELALHANDLQKHRGPDSQAVWSKDNTVLCHQRLAIIDLEARSNQPFTKNELTIIFNGEIYNYRELREELLQAAPGIVFRTESDTEVVLELFRHSGEKCLDKLVGMFAFAIYNEVNGHLFIARDHFGIKPVFYTQYNNQFAFSSELKTLAKLPGRERKINKAALCSALFYQWVPEQHCMIEGIHKLPSAHFASINTRSANIELKITKYWELKGNTITASEDKITEQLRAELEATVERHMVADVEVACFLSGGLDSSLISVLAAEKVKTLHTFTIATSSTDKKVEQMPDDEKYARKVAEKFGLNHHEIVIHPDIVSDLKKMVHTLDEPIGDPAALNTYLICNAARQSGIKVLLSGMGADEIFFGYRRQKALLLSGKFEQLPSPVKKLIKKVVFSLPVKLGNYGIKPVRWAQRFLSLSSTNKNDAYLRSYTYYSANELNQLLTFNASDEVALLEQQHRTIFNSHYSNDLVNQVCYTDTKMFMNGLNLTYSDRASMAASVELRVPFIDKQLVSFAMTIEGKHKFKNGQSKYILKKAAEKWLPEEIIYRPKASFGAPIRSWISKDLKPMVNDLLSRESIVKRGLFNPDYVQKLISDDEAGKKDNAYRIYQLLTIELWLQNFMDA